LALPELQTLRYEVQDGIATITLHRPEKLNAFTAQMRDELIAAFDETDADDAVRAVIVTGAGRAFCAGADLSSGGKTFDYAARAEEARDNLRGVDADALGELEEHGGGRKPAAGFPGVEHVALAAHSAAERDLGAAPAQRANQLNRELFVVHIYQISTLWTCSAPRYVRS